MRLISLLALLTLVFSTAATAQNGPVTLTAASHTVRTGETVCLNISATGLQRMLSMQYSLQWDPKVLAFSGVTGFKLPFLTKENFGTQVASSGTLTCMWIDNNLKGVTLPDGSALYQVCFKVVGKSGSTSSLKFVSKPTPFEAVNYQERLVLLRGKPGTITVK